MARKAPGKAHREGITLVDLMDMFPTEEAATKWFESVVWANGRYCGKCGSDKTREVPNAKPMPYWCTDCRSYFSVRTGTPIARSQRAAAQVGHRDLPVPDQPQKRVEHEAPPGYRRLAADGLVHAAPDQAGMGW